MEETKVKFLNTDRILIIVITVLWLGTIIFSGVQYERKNNYKDDLKEANKQYKELLESNKTSISNAKELTDSAGIYALYGQKEGIKADKVGKKIVIVKKKGNENIKALESFSRDAHVKLFNESTIRFHSDTTGQH